MLLCFVVGFLRTHFTCGSPNRQPAAAEGISLRKINTAACYTDNVMKLRRLFKVIKENAPMSFKGWVVFFSFIAAASLICLFLRTISTSDVHVPMIFVLAVLLIALFTDGYFYGILAALMSVVFVNYAFTYPYNTLDFSITGYPLTFLTMLTVGCVVSALTSRVKRQEERRIESEKERVRANFLRAMSHDLRTPLTSIGGSIGTILENEEILSEEEKHALLKGAQADSVWLSRMVENILSITRIGDGGVRTLHKEQELLEEVIAEAVRNFSNRYPQLRVEVRVPEEPVFVPMDALLIEQVLINLMDNAAVHGEKTTVIRISASCTENEALIKVEDDGKGIDPAVFASLFEEFLPESEENEGDKKRGMGIGLMVCRTIMETHGGSIRAENCPEGGARFICTLPLGTQS